MRTYRVKVEIRDEEGGRRTETRTIAASNLHDAKAKAHHRFGTQRVKEVSPARREQTMEGVWDVSSFDTGAPGDAMDEEEEGSLAIDLKDIMKRDRKRSFEPATNMCPDCSGSGEGRRGDICNRCDGNGEVFESIKPTFIQYLVESMDEQKTRATLQSAIGPNRWERKPVDWNRIRNTFEEKDLAKSGLSYADIPTYHLGDLYYEDDRNFPKPMDKFTMQKPRETIFFLRVPGEGTYLVNTEGADYVRYALKSALPRAKFG